MQRQSSIADRSVALLELSEIQRDSNYEETKLIVKYKQGKEAGSAFDRQRRAPAVRVGGLLFLTGFVFMASTFFTDAPSWFGELFAAVGLGTRSDRRVPRPSPWRPREHQESSTKRGSVSALSTGCCSWRLFLVF